ncbi:hypothetical protein PcaKH15_13070 [Parageobacillus caldoxylosilyticus]|jgi:hypothetical protein|uniref:Uncharacterized protein n=1 Tax=Parageobacillus caldoxylosilyticus NBRC 107762 TaxID=1220594 RepID=A0A023DJR7_9BACL|nr:hypothetical protein [Parageobacillus caldoxylosilyticus]BDG35401.1 hypothetical protein PcaKH15_13070 [Parageobacillus caldoxylosilyticus]BDG39179.1 hypothetical protein PcaKH16_13180 [Parageobacillus caldoxylosilyticus]BDG42962.1 hypothetical protein PcaKH35_13070 [Parageobacillus caldoxylosilyticus]GAJ41514.1 hypothetical protein GCA01S_073_00100 [Parageobacillus caldoxylosilyticus NBRC 107762]
MNNALITTLSVKTGKLVRVEDIQIGMEIAVLSISKEIYPPELQRSRRYVISGNRAIIWDFHDLKTRIATYKRRNGGNGNGWN